MDSDEVGAQRAKREAELRQAKAEVQEFEAWVLEQNKTHALVTLGGKSQVLIERPHPVYTRQKMVEFVAPATLRDRWKNLPYSKKRRSPFDRWLESPLRRSYEGTVFEPGGGEQEGYYNLWTGFAVEPQKGNCVAYMEHLRDVIAGGDRVLARWIFSWMARIVQHPGEEKPGTAVALKGKEGTGKSRFVCLFGELFGQHFLHCMTPRGIMGQFNAHLENKVLTFLDEAIWAGNRGEHGALYGLLTEQTLNIERKGKDIEARANHQRVMLATNHDWVVPAGPNARRFCVAEVSDAREQDHVYFKALQEQMDDGGREALLWTLLNWDAGEINIRSVPRTNELANQIEMTLDPFEQYWFERLMGGEPLQGSTKWEQVVPKAQLVQEFQESTRLSGRAPHAMQIHVGRKIKKIHPDSSNLRPLRDVEVKELGMLVVRQLRVRCWDLPDLEQCRADFEKFLGQPIEWEEYPLQTD